MGTASLLASSTSRELIAHLRSDKPFPGSNLGNVISPGNHVTANPLGACRLKCEMSALTLTNALTTTHLQVKYATAQRISDTTLSSLAFLSSTADVLTKADTLVRYCPA